MMLLLAWTRLSLSCKDVGNWGLLEGSALRLAHDTFHHS